jgi:ferredoxin/flavodoxin---NADP+ reductase
VAQYFRETITDVQHWTNSLFTIQCTRNSAFQFKSGEFTVIGLEGDKGNQTAAQPYGIASAIYDEHLEFYSDTESDSALASRLSRTRPGDSILVGKKVVGPLRTDNLLPGKRLYMLSTGTGFAPFASLLKDPAIYELYDNIIATQTTRYVDELAYGNQVLKEIAENPFFSHHLTKLSVYQSVTRDTPFNFATATPVPTAWGRITRNIKEGRFFDTMHLPRFNPVDDRIMICGNPSMVNELSEYLTRLGFELGSATKPGHYVIEKAFIEKHDG